MAESESYRWEFDHGEEVCGEFFVARGDTALMSDLVEESLHQIAFFIEIGIECAWRLAVLFEGNVGLRAKLRKKHRRGLAVVGLAGGEQEADRQAPGIDQGVDLGRQPSSATTHATISTPVGPEYSCGLPKIIMVSAMDRWELDDLAHFG